MANILHLVEEMVASLRRNPSFNGESPAKGAGYTVRGRFRATPRHGNILAPRPPKDPESLIEEADPAFRDLTGIE